MLHGVLFCLYFNQITKKQCLRNNSPVGKWPGILPFSDLGVIIPVFLFITFVYKMYKRFVKTTKKVIFLRE